MEADCFSALRKHRWVEPEATDSTENYLFLSERGFAHVLDDAKAILKTRFLLGLDPIPSGGSIDLTTDSQIASALLIFLYFRESIFFEEVFQFLGIFDDGTAERLISELLSRRLIREEDYPRFHETWYQLTASGKERCECWLSGLPRPNEWPFRALLFANRRHNFSFNKMSRLVSDLDIRALSSAGLEALAFEYAKRELRLKNTRHVGGPSDGKADLLAEDHANGSFCGVLVQCKQTAESSLRIAGIKKELTGLQLPDHEKPWKYILFTNAKDSRRLGDIVTEMTKLSGFIHATIVSRTSLESFLTDKDNQDLVPRFFPQVQSLASVALERKMPRRYEWSPSMRVDHFEALLRSYFPDNRGKLIVRDLEYEDSYPYTIYPDLEPPEWMKLCVMGFDEDGLIYGNTADGMLYRIPFDSMVLWDQWTRDPLQGLPHLYVAGLDRIESLNRSYMRAKDPGLRVPVK
jgi:hypothetical protein